MNTNIEITDKIIIEPKLELPTRDTGATVEFRGIVRETEDENCIQGLDYEAYKDMAIAKMTTILSDLLVKHDCLTGVVIHRVGFIPVGESALYMRITSSHRKEAFSCCSEFIDELKKDVPIWKAN
tara:strand:- start:275 stop:649 length:375 start_codon:yes stop_codon:yes gene_type:complete